MSHLGDVLIPADVDFWLEKDEEKEWLALLKSTPVATLTALLSFWSVHLLVPLIARPVLTGLSPSGRVRFQHQ